MSGNLVRLSIEEFIAEALVWRERYLENNECALKVEAFIQRRWGSPCLEAGRCAGQLPRVEELIERWKGNEDIDGLEDMEVVYRWGGGFGPMIFAQITRANLPGRVRMQVKAAYDALNEGPPAQALREMQSLKHCGDSFGSKVLAMRCPERAPIWDNIAKDCLSEFRVGGRRVKSYEQFIRFCEHVADGLKEQGAAPPKGCDGSPREADGRWWLRDVEMAVFQFGWATGKDPGRITGEIP